MLDRKQLNVEKLICLLVSATVRGLLTRVALVGVIWTSLALTRFVRKSAAHAGAVPRAAEPFNAN
jgi:hypothetical protein